MAFLVLVRDRLVLVLVLVRDRLVLVLVLVLVRDRLVLVLVLVRDRLVLVLVLVITLPVITFPVVTFCDHIATNESRTARIKGQVLTWKSPKNESVGPP